MRPQPAGHAPAGLHLVKNERHIINTRQETQLAHEARARQTHAPFALNRLDEHRGNAPRPLDDVGSQLCALRLDEDVQGAEVPAGLCQELVDGVQLAPISVFALFRSRHPSGHQKIPKLFQAALLATRRFFGGGGFLDGKGNVRPIECRKAQSRSLGMRDRQAAQCAAVEGTFEGHDEASVTVL